MTTSTPELRPFVSYGTVLETFEAIVADAPVDYINPTFPLPDGSQPNSCKYVHYDEHGQPDAPSCIVGQLAYRLGMTLDELSAREGKPGVSIIVEFFDIDNETISLIRNVQINQDSSRDWRNSLDRAINA